MIPSSLGGREESMRLPVRRPHIPLLAGLLLALLAVHAAGPAGAAPGGAVFDVTDYGAIPDDGNSDHLAFNAALAAASATPDGGIVHLPCGTYTASPSFYRGAFRVQSGQDNIWIQGASTNCVTIEPHATTTNGVALISICPDTGFFQCNTSLAHPTNIWVSGMRLLDPDGAAHAGNEETHGIVAKCRNCRFFDLVFERIGDEALDIKESADIGVERITCRGAGFISGGINHGSCVNVQASTDVHIVDIHCEDSSGGTTAPYSWCVQLESFHDTIPIQNVVIERVVARGWRAGGINVQATVSAADDLLIRDNWIETPLVSAKYAILINGLESKTGVRVLANRLRGPVFVAYSDDLTVADNQISTRSFAGIEVRGSQDAMIARNLIRGGRSECILAPSAEGLSIVGNRCVEMGGFNKSVISVKRDFFRRGPVAILDNVIDVVAQSSNGIEASGLTDGDVTIRGNTIRGAGGRGILGQGLIQGNRVVGAGNAGIELNGTAADGSQVVDNRIEGSGGSCILAIGTDGVRVQGNRVRQCSSEGIRLSAANGNHLVQLTDNDADNTLRADGSSSICTNNRADGDVRCGGPDSVVMGNIVPPAYVVDGSGPGSQKVGNLE